MVVLFVSMKRFEKPPWYVSINGPNTIVEAFERLISQVTTIINSNNNNNHNNDKEWITGSSCTYLFQDPELSAAQIPTEPKEAVFLGAQDDTDTKK